LDLGTDLTKLVLDLSYKIKPLALSPIIGDVHRYQAVVQTQTTFRGKNTAAAEVTLGGASALGWGTGSIVRPWQR
jgi:hypothetical protein